MLYIAFGQGLPRRKHGNGTNVASLREATTKIDPPIPPLYKGGQGGVSSVAKHARTASACDSLRL